MFDRIRESQPVRSGLKVAGVHFVRAAYEIVAGVGAFVGEIVDAVRDQDDQEDRAGPEGPTRIEVD